MHFFHSIWKNLHLTEIFYTGTACGACDKYEVCTGGKGGLMLRCVLILEYFNYNKFPNTLQEESVDITNTICS